MPSCCDSGIQALKKSPAILASKYVGQVEALNIKPSVPDVNFATVVTGVETPPISNPSVPDERPSFLLYITEYHESMAIKWRRFVTQMGWFNWRHRWEASRWPMPHINMVPSSVGGVLELTNNRLS